MNFNWKKWSAEMSVVVAGIVWFLAPSLQAYAAGHPHSSASVLIAALLALALKPSPLAKQG